jgi:hypothetical protein
LATCAFRSAGSELNSSAAFGWTPIVLEMMNSSRARPTPSLGSWQKSNASCGLPTFIAIFTGIFGMRESSTSTCSYSSLPL